MRARKLSHVSPLGAALMGKKKGDVFTFRDAKREADLHDRKSRIALSKKRALRKVEGSFLTFMLGFENVLG